MTIGNFPANGSAFYPTDSRHTSTANWSQTCDFFDFRIAGDPRTVTEHDASRNMTVLSARPANYSSALLHAVELLEEFPNTVQSNDQRKTKVMSERKFVPRKYKKMRKRKMKNKNLKEIEPRESNKQWQRKEEDKEQDEIRTKKEE